MWYSFNLFKLLKCNINSSMVIIPSWLPCSDYFEPFYHISKQLFHITKLLLLSGSFNSVTTFILSIWSLDSSSLTVHLMFYNIIPKHSEVLLFIPNNAVNETSLIWDSESDGQTDPQSTDRTINLRSHQTIGLCGLKIVLEFKHIWETGRRVTNTYT